MSYNNVDNGSMRSIGELLASGLDKETAFFGDHRSLPSSGVFEYDLDFMQDECGEHAGYVLHPFTPKYVDEVFELVQADGSNGYEDHFHGTLVDDYSNLTSLYRTFNNPGLLMQGVARFVICGPNGEIVGRLDHQPSKILSSQPKIEMLLWIAGDKRQQGIGSYVTQRFLADVFRNYESVQTVEAGIFHDNYMGRRLVESVGYIPQGEPEYFEEVPSQPYVYTRDMFFERD